MSEALYIRVKKELKEELERMAKEKKLHLVDVASQAIERGLKLDQPASSKAEKLIGIMKLKTCRHMAEDGYCNVWELSKEDA
jgi:predicted transcriptional regulator